MSIQSGSICNVPLDTNSIANTLPQGADSNGIIMVKLKRKLVYRGHVYFEAVRPDMVRSALQYLKINNPLYSDIIIDIGQIPENLLTLSEPVECTEEVDMNQSNSRELPEEDIDNPLDSYKFGSTETVLFG